MDSANFKKGDEVVYLDKATRSELPATIQAVDYSIIPPSYLVRIPKLDTVRETVASRLLHRDQAARDTRAPADAAPVAVHSSSTAGQPQLEEGRCCIPQPADEPQTPPRDALSQPLPTPTAPLKKNSKSKRRRGQRQRSRQQHLDPVVRAPQHFEAAGSERTACDVPVAHLEPRAQRPAANQRSSRGSSSRGSSSRGRQAGVSCAALAPRQARYVHADPWGLGLDPDTLMFGLPLRTWSDF